MWQALKRVTLRHWAWIHVMLSLALWAVLILNFTPVGVYAALQQPIIGIWTTVTIIGALVAVVGLVLSLANSPRKRVLSISVELFGLILAATGPFTYLAAQVSLLFADAFSVTLDVRLALVAFAYYGLSIIIYRILIVVPRFRKEAQDVRKDV